jgi:hypothetical protein
MAERGLHGEKGADPLSPVGELAGNSGGRQSPRSCSRESGRRSTREDAQEQRGGCRVWAEQLQTSRRTAEDPQGRT